MSTVTHSEQYWDVCDTNALSLGILHQHNYIMNIIYQVTYKKLESQGHKEITKNQAMAKRSKAASPEHCKIFRDLIDAYDLLVKNC